MREEKPISVEIPTSRKNKYEIENQKLKETLEKLQTQLQNQSRIIQELKDSIVNLTLEKQGILIKQARQTLE